jgi:two-component system NtrC family sensor kinase
MFPQTIKFKVSLYLAIALSPAMLLFPFLVVQFQREHLQAEVAQHVVQISELIVKSTRYAMLMDERELVDKIIHDIGRQKGIERVRVVNKDGEISYSNRSAEVGQLVRQEDEPCVNCHQTSKPLAKVPDDQRWKVYETAGGRRVLTAMQPILNEHTCSSDSCHEHRASQTVLGLVDVAYSLDELDQSIKQHSSNILGGALGVVLLVAASVGLLLQRMIYLPLRDLESGAKTISSGNLDHRIPVRSVDDFGRLAVSFNQMTSALKGSRSEIEELVQTLESKVEEKSQALQVAQAEVAQGEKLAAIGQLASGIAHELNSPLTGILTFASLLRKKMNEGSQDAEDLDLVIRETKRCASIIKRLLDFAREKVPLKERFNLNRLIEDTVRLIDRPASLQQVEIITDLDEELPEIWGDADLIKQVLLNVLVNAEQSISGAGTVLVETRKYLPKASTPAGPEPQPMVEIAVKDTGCGIPEANLQRIFDPFFTSKEVGKGTGLGLSVSHGIVKSHGGEIKVESHVGAGSTFRIYLPIDAPMAEVKPAAEGSSA